MFKKDAELAAELRRVAASHKSTGERRTADLLERARLRIIDLTTKHEYVDCPSGTGCSNCYGLEPAEGKTDG